MIWIKPIITTLIFIISFNTRPLKLRIVLVGIRGLIFLYLQENVGSTWFSLIFFLIFIGGIIVVFIILSAITPNQKYLKINSKIVFVIIMLRLPTAFLLPSDESLTIRMKWFISRNTNILIGIAIMLLYFFSFIYITTKEKYPIR